MAQQYAITANLQMETVFASENYNQIFRYNISFRNR
jgi:hypothetical protein